MSKSRNIYQRMHDIMQDVSYIQKEDKKVNNQYKFVSHDAVTAKIRVGLLNHGVMAVPNFFDISQDGNKTCCSMEMTFICIDNPDDRLAIPCAGFGQGIDPQDKGAGKAMSYAYKYAILKVFALETGDDPERDSIEHVDSDQCKATELYHKLNNNLAEFEDGKEFKQWWSVDIKSDREELKRLDVSQSNKLIKNMQIQSTKFTSLPPPSNV